MELSTGGIHVTLPDGWEGAASRPRAVSRDARFGSGSGPAPASLPTLHLGTFGLPPDRGDFGSGAVELMSGDDAFVAVVEYGTECAGTPLFAAPALPRRLRPDELDPQALQRILPGQAGMQAFATERGRPLCLYVVVADRTRGAVSLRNVNRLLAGLRVEPRGTA